MLCQESMASLDQLVTVWTPFVTNRKEQQFLFNTEYIQQYNALKSEARKGKVPGHIFFKKLDDFIESCMITGEMFHEYCDMSQWIPPFVQFQKSTNFQSITILPVAETPITNADDAKRREVDDCHHVHSESTKRMKSVSSRIMQVFTPFATDTLLKKVLWKKYLEHLNHLEIISEKRKKQEFERKHNVLWRIWLDGNGVIVED